MEYIHQKRNVLISKRLRYLAFKISDSGTSKSVRTQCTK